MNVAKPSSNLFSWSSDPVVLFEKAVMPASPHVYRLLCNRSTTRPPRDLPDIASTAVHMLRIGALVLLKARGVRPDDVGCAALEDAARALDIFEQQYRADVPVDVLLALADSSVIPALECALDAYRRMFITHVLSLQSQHAKQARGAIDELGNISKQIYFISINASIEAAHVGDAGRGFKQISGDIRALSGSAQQAIKQLSATVAVD